jgi:hypothetical protein
LSERTVAFRWFAHRRGTGCARISSSRARWRSCACLAAALALGACREKEAPAPAASASLADAPAPASLVAEVSVGNPKETWQRLRVLGGDLAQALPLSLPVLFTTSLSLPPAAAGSLDEAVPMVGALLSPPGRAEPDAVVGVHVTSGPELVASLTLGSAAKFRSVQLGPRLVRLVAAPGAAELNGALGVSGNYLLLASRVEALTDAGRFVAETVARRARTEPGVTLRASERMLRGPLAQRLRDAWQAHRGALAARDRAERDAKGRPPDFGDPAVLLAGADSTVQSWISVLESASELELSLTPEATRLRVELTLKPSGEGAAALLSRELVTGPIGPLLALPQGALAGVLMQGEAQPTAEAAEAFGKSVSELFGERVTNEQAQKLTQVLAALIRARHGATVIGFVPAPKPAVLVTCQVTDAEAFQTALADTLGLVELPPVNKWLAGTVGQPTLRLTKSPGGARRAVVRFARPKASGGVPLPASLTMSWEAKDGLATVVVSPDESLGVGAWTGVTQLGASPFLAESGQDWDKQAALSVFADARLLAPGGPDDAPILLAMGRRKERIAVSIDLSPAALRSVAQFWVR